MKRRRRVTHVVKLDRELRQVARLSLADYNAGSKPQPIICCRVADGPPHIASRQGTCDLCLARIWIAPSTEDLLPQMRAPTLWCMPCLLDQLKANAQHL